MADRQGRVDDLHRAADVDRLSIIGVPLALTLGLIAGLLSFIPNFGPIISAVPAILLAFIDSPITAVYVLGLYVGVQLIESNIVTPLIERETVELPPALTIVFQLALAVLVGGSASCSRRRCWR